MSSRILKLLGILPISLFVFPCFVHAGDELSFDLDEFERKPFEWGGYVEFKWDHININQGSGFSL